MLKDENEVVRLGICLQEALSHFWQVIEMIERVADAHIHICEEDWRFGIDLVFTWNDLQELFAEGIIANAVVLPMMSNTDNSLDVNKEFFKKLQGQQYRDKIWAYYWPHPHEVDFQFAAGEHISGVKYHPSISQVRIDNAPDVIRAARDNGLPLLVHCGRNQMSRIQYVLTAHRMEPDVVFVGAHLGGLANELILAALDQIDSMSRRDNLYLDTSGCMNPKIMRRAVEVMGEDRILWGTDLPFFNHKVSRFVLEQTGLDSEAMRKILYDNVAKLHNGGS